MTSEPNQEDYPPAMVAFLIEATAMLKTLDLPPSFAYDLAGEDDWGFILKSHSLLDAALEHVLLKKCFGVSEGADAYQLKRFVSGLNWKGKASKQTLAKAFSVATPESIKYIDVLTDVRNAYAHNIYNVGKTIDEISKDNDLKIDVLMGGLPSDKVDGIGKKFVMAFGVLTVLWDLRRSTGAPSVMLSELFPT